MRIALILVAIITLCVIISSFQSIDGKAYVNTYSHGQYSLPIKQSYFVVTEDHKKALRLVKKGWELQDVDFFYANGVNKYYTLIKYAN